MADPTNSSNVSNHGETPQGNNRAKTAESQGSGPGGSESKRNEVSAGEEPSGYRGDNPASAGPGGTGIRSATPENAGGHINPSSPGNTGTTPGTTPEE